MTRCDYVDPSVNTIAIAQADLDARIAAAFADDAKSKDVAMIKDTEYMDDVAFKRDRLQAALGKLRERLAQLKDQEENARRQVAYDKA